MRALPINWTAIAVMAAHGTTLAQISKQTGVALSTLKARSRREGWKRAGVAEQERQVQVAVAAKQMAPVATDAVQVTANTLADDSRETRASLSRAARKLAKQAESATLEEAGDALQVGKLAALTHGWDKQSGQSVRVSIYSHDGGLAAAEVIDVEAVPIEDAPSQS